MTAGENYDENASLITGFGCSQSPGLTVILNEISYTKPVENPLYYQKLIDLQSISNSCSIMDMTALVKPGATHMPPRAAR
jgi:hypothetical protein